MTIKMRITNEMIEKSLMKLYEYGNQSINVTNVQSLESM